MTNNVPSFPDTPTHVLSLVSVALDEFESVPLAANVRRALRIARLRGDLVEAYRFALELGLDVVPPDQDESSADPEWPNRVVAEFASNRTHKGGTSNQPIDELVAQEIPFEQELSLRTRMESHNRKILAEQLLSVVRNLTFRYLADCETELRISVTGERLFGRHRLRVDRILRELAPDVLDKLSSGLRRANESGDPEPRAQALLSCRRVLVALADIVFPSQDEPFVDSKGFERPVTSKNYRNRILAGLESRATSTYFKAGRSCDR